MPEPTIHHFVNGRIFTGESWLTEAFITVEGDRIVEISAHRSGATGRVPPDRWKDLQGGLLVPAFIDVQLYGGDGQLFGVHPTVEAIRSTV